MKIFLVSNCKHDILWVRSPLEETEYLIFSFLRFGVEIGKRGTECLNTRFPLSILLSAGSSVTLKKTVNNNLLEAFAVHQIVNYITNINRDCVYNRISST